MQLPIRLFVWDTRLVEIARVSRSHQLQIAFGGVHMPGIRHRFILRLLEIIFVRHLQTSLAIHCLLFLDKGPITIFLESNLELALGIHDDRTIPGYRFADWLARKQ